MWAPEPGRMRPGFGRRMRLPNGGIPANLGTGPRLDSWDEQVLLSRLDNLACSHRDDRSRRQCDLRPSQRRLQQRKPIDVIRGGDYLEVAELVSALEEAPLS